MSKTQKTFPCGSQYLDFCKYYRIRTDETGERIMEIPKSKLDQLIRELYEELTARENQCNSTGFYGEDRDAVLVSDIRTVFERFTGSEYTQERKG